MFLLPQTRFSPSAKLTLCSGFGFVLFLVSLTVLGEPLSTFCVVGDTVLGDRGRSETVSVLALV